MSALVGPAGGELVEVRSRHVLLATGGAGQLFAVTTNPVEATGDGVAMALRAGVPVADVEFVQFHPTALHHPAMPRPLLSEALRGHGALLRDAKGERFVDELLPRDAVSRAMTARMLEQERRPPLARRHRSSTASPSGSRPSPRRSTRPGSTRPSTGCRSLPRPTTSAGASSPTSTAPPSMPGLWAAGEVACNGVHGANRLASNSLLDGMVFAARVVEAIERGKHGPERTGAMRAVLGGEGGLPGRRLGFTAPSPLAAGTLDVAEARDRLQRALTIHAGVLRSASSLDAAAASVASADAVPAGAGRDRHELANLADVARALVAAATAREESRGAHTRTDFPETDPAGRIRYVVG